MTEAHAFKYTPEVELKWCQQDLRIAADNLKAAQRRLDEAADQFQQALEAETAARHALKEPHARPHL